MKLPRIAQVECGDYRYFVFSSQDLIANHLFRFGTWEQGNMLAAELLVSNLEKPAVLDIGANLGLFSVPVAKKIEPKDGKIFCFEPQRIVFQQLCANLFQNGVSNAHTFNEAISDETGTIDIPSFDYNQVTNVGAFSLSKDLDDKRGRVVGALENEADTVNVNRLDDLKIPLKTGLIKIDVEGLEINVIRSGHNFLREHNYPPILFEAWNADWFAAEKDALFKEFRSLGYRIDTLGGDNYLAQHAVAGHGLTVTWKDKNTIDLRLT